MAIAISLDIFLSFSVTSTEPKPVHILILIRHCETQIKKGSLAYELTAYQFLWL